MAVETAEEFRYLIITDSATNQGIAISKIEFDVVGEDVFEYTISDTDGDFDTAYLTIDSSTLLDDDTDV
jgi:predicted nucleotidyltransferase